MKYFGVAAVCILLAACSGTTDAGGRGGASAEDVVPPPTAGTDLGTPPRPVIPSGGTDSGMAPPAPVPPEATEDAGTPDSGAPPARLFDAGARTDAGGQDLGAVDAGTSPDAGDRPDAGQGRPSVDFDELVTLHGGDFTAALQTGIDQLDATGGTIYLSPRGSGAHGGIYEVRTTAELTRTGTARITVRTRPSEANSAEVRQTIPGDLIVLQGVSELELRGLTLRADAALGGNGIRVSGGERLTLAQLSVQQAGGVGVHVSSAREVLMQDVRTDAVGVHGIRLSNCEDVTIERAELNRSSVYGIGIQNGRQLSTNIRVLDSVITNSGADGVDVKGQRLDGSPLFIVDGLTIVHTERTGGKAALDLRGHVDVRNVRISVANNNPAVRMRRGEDIGTNLPGNGWAGYGVLENVRVTTQDGTGEGFIIGGGGATLVNSRAVGFPATRPGLWILNESNPARAITLDDFRFNSRQVSNVQQILSYGGIVSNDPILVFR